MAERYEIAVKVISQKGSCDAKHKVGQEWVIKKDTPEGICLSAFTAMYPSVRALMFGGVFPWAKDPDIAVVACPDAENPVVFEVRRIRK